MAEPVEQQHHEDKAAQYAHNQLDGELVRGDDHPADHVAPQHEDGAEQGRVHQRAADLVPLEHGHHIGDDQADVGDGAHDHNHAGGDHRGDGQPEEQHQVVGHAQVLGDVLPHTDNIEVVGKQKGQGDQRYDQVDQLIPAAEHHGEVAHGPGGQGLSHLILVGQIVGEAADDIAEHDAHQGNHDHVLELDALNEPDKGPGTQNGKDEGEKRPSPQSGVWQEQEGQKNAELGRGDGGSGGGRDEFVHAELLHDQTGHTHTDPGTQDRQQAGQTRDQKNLQLFELSRQQPGQVYIDHAEKQ